VTDRADEEQLPASRQQAEPREPAVPAIVEAQVETARAGVFRAWVRAREKARHLAEEGPGGPGDPRHGAS
jgi:hypothetical protein